MKVIKSQLFIALALFVGVAIGYFAGESPAEPAPAASGTNVMTRATIADRGEAVSIVALRRRVAELERLLNEKGEESRIAISNAVAEAVRNATPDRPRGNPREWMENLKKNEPERYVQMTNRFAQWRQRRVERAQSKIGFLASVDTSHMSTGAKKTHSALQDLLARREEIEAQLHQEGLSDSARGELMREMFETHRELRRLNQEERANLFDETARALGFEGDDAKEITATIQDVIEATDGGFDGPPRPNYGRHGNSSMPPPGGPVGR